LFYKNFPGFVPANHLVRGIPRELRLCFWLNTTQISALAEESLIYDKHQKELHSEIARLKHQLGSKPNNGMQDEVGEVYMFSTNVFKFETLG
jgi:hypothetical protein